MYDPRIGRFLSEDPLGFAAGDTNLNRYVGNSPTNYIDPMGLEPPIFGENEFPEQGRFHLREKNPYWWRRVAEGAWETPITLEKNMTIPRGTFVSAFPKLQQLSDIKKGTPTILSSDNHNAHRQNPKNPKVWVAKQGQFIRVPWRNMYGSGDSGDLVGTTAAQTCIGVIAIEKCGMGRSIYAFHFDSETSLVELSAFPDDNTNEWTYFVFGGDNSDQSNHTLNGVLKMLPHENTTWFDSHGLWVDQDGHPYIFKGEVRFLPPLEHE